MAPVKELIVFLLCQCAFADINGTSTTSPNTCFGEKPEYDKPCAKYTTQKACQAQVACLWGDKTRDKCDANDDPKLKAACSKIKSETKCKEQVGCAWRSSSDISNWVTATNTAVQGLQATAKALPKTVSLSSASHITSTHDHLSVNSAQLESVLKAWQTKYELPAAAVTTMSSLVAAESVSYKSIHNIVQPGSGSLQLIACAGRKWNDLVSLAFVYGTISATVTTYNPDMKCDKFAYALPSRPSEMDAAEPDTDTDDDDSESVLAEFAPSAPAVFKEMDAVLLRKGDSRRRAPACNANKAKLCSSSNDCLIPQHRSLTASEVASVDTKLQAGLFPKLSAEATLLEVDLKHNAPSPIEILM